MLTLQRNGNINLLDEKVYELDMEVKQLKAENKENKEMIKLLLERVEKLEKGQK
ncbi:hypothetical protein STFE110948_03570 [Streptobacillus felis]